MLCPLAVGGPRRQGPPDGLPGDRFLGVGLVEGQDLPAHVQCCFLVLLPPRHRISRQQGLTAVEDVPLAILQRPVVCVLARDLGHRRS